MKLRNKKTGGVIEIDVEKSQLKFRRLDDKTKTISFGSLAELNEEWEDYEEPKPQVLYYIDRDGEIVPYKNVEYPKRVFNAEQNKQIGNHFETREEAEKAVEKAKAIVRLNKCGFRFEGYNNRDRANGGDIVIYAHVNTPNNSLIEEAQPDMLKDLDLLFGGEK